jgi:hypothetical protein
MWLLLSDNVADTPQLLFGLNTIIHDKKNSVGFSHVFKQIIH